MPAEGDASPAPGPKVKYVFAFQVKRTEADIEAAFLTKSGTLGAAAARAETDFALTHSDTAASRLITETLETVRLPIPERLLAQIPKEVNEAVHAQKTAQAGATIVLPARARLNMTASRVATSINGTLVGTMSGQGSARLQELFSDEIPIQNLIENGSVQVDQLGELKQLITPKAPTTSQPPKVEVIAADYKELADTMALNVKARVPVPFETIPIKYSNWGTHQAVMAVYQPRVLCLTTDASGATTETPMNTVVWYDDPKEAAAIAKVEPLLQGIYNTAWAMTEKVVFEPVKNLTKSIMRVPVGYNGSGYALAAAVNDTPISFAPATLERILASCLATELPSSEIAQCLADLAHPSLSATARWGPDLANAVSAYSAYSTPYRVDGTPIVMPTGVQMVQSESWRAEASRSIIHADDCDGSACGAVSVINFAAGLKQADLDAFPVLRAIANSLGAHYVTGTSVIAANAGHADAADENAQTIAGHAVAVAIPKVSFLKALETGYAGSARKKVADARFKAVYPATLIERLPEEERSLFADFVTLKRQELSDPVTGLQPLAMEGTTFASSCMYTHNANDRHNRKAWYAMDKKVATSLSPNITRAHKTLDVGENDGHAFYLSMVELGVSMKHPLFKDPTLRGHEMATAQFRFAQPPKGADPINAAGASPEQIAKHEFAMLPLWEVNTKIGETLDLAHDDAASNVLPRRDGPYRLNEQEVEKLNASLESLGELKKHLDANLEAAAKDEHGQRKDAHLLHETLHIVSFASLVHNPNAIEAFVETITEAEGIASTALGGVRGLDEVIDGVAMTPTGEQAGRMVVLSLHVPVPE